MDEARVPPALARQKFGDDARFSVQAHPDHNGVVSPFHRLSVLQPVSLLLNLIMRG